MLASHYTQEEVENIRPEGSRVADRSSRASSSKAYVSSPVSYPGGSPFVGKTISVSKIKGTPVRGKLLQVRLNGGVAAPAVDRSHLLSANEDSILNASMFQNDESLSSSAWIENPHLQTSLTQGDLFEENCNNSEQPHAKEDVAESNKESDTNSIAELRALTKLEAEIDEVFKQDETTGAASTPQVDPVKEASVLNSSIRSETSTLQTPPRSSPSVESVAHMSQNALLALQNLDTPPEYCLRSNFMSSIFASNGMTDADPESVADLGVSVVRKLMSAGLSAVAETAEEISDSESSTGEVRPREVQQWMSLIEEESDANEDDIEQDEGQDVQSESDYLSPHLKFKKLSRRALLRGIKYLQTTARQAQLELSEVRAQQGHLRKEGGKLLAAYENKSERLDIARRERRTLVEQLTYQQSKEEMMTAEKCAIEAEYDRLYESFTGFMTMFKEREAEVAKLQDERDTLSSRLISNSSELKASRKSENFDAEDDISIEEETHFTTSISKETFAATQASAASIESSLRARIAALETELAAAHTESRVQQVQRRVCERDAQEALAMLREEHIAKIDETVQIRNQLHTALTRAQAAEIAAVEAEHRAIEAEGRRDEAEWAYSDVSVSIESRDSIIAYLKGEYERSQILLRETQKHLQDAASARHAAEEQLQIVVQRQEKSIKELDNRYLASQYKERYLELAQENTALRTQLGLVQATADEARDLVSLTQTLQSQLETRQKYVEQLYQRFDYHFIAAKEAREQYDSVCSDLQACEQELVTCEETLGVSTEELAAERARSEELTKQLDEQNIQFAEIRKHLESEQAARKALEADLAASESEQARLSQLIEDLELRESTLSSELAEMKVNLDSQVEVVADRDTQLLRAREQLRESEASLSVAQAGLEHAQLDLTFLREEVARRKERATTAEAQVASLREEMRHIREVKRADEDETIQIVSQNYDGDCGATATIGFTTSLRRNPSRGSGSCSTICLDTMNEQNSALTGISPTNSAVSQHYQHDEAESILRVTKDQLAAAEQECSRLRATAAKAEGRASHAEEELERAQKRILRNEESYKDSFTAVAAAQNEARQAKCDVERLEKELEVALQTLDDQRESARVWKLEVVEANKEATDALENLQSELTTARVVVERYEKLCDELKQEVQILEMNCEELKAQLAIAQAQLVTARSDMIDGETKALSLNEAETQDLRTRLAKRESDLHAVRAKAKEYRETARGAVILKEQLESCQAELEAMKKSRQENATNSEVEKSLREEIAMLRAESDNLRKKVTVFESSSVDMKGAEQNGDDDATTADLTEGGLQDKKVRQLQSQIEKLRRYVVEYKEQGDRKLHSVSMELQGEKDMRHGLTRKITKIRDVIRKHSEVLGSCNVPDISALVKVCLSSSSSAPSSSSSTNQE